METKSDAVMRYRKAHPRCRYCKHLEIDQYQVPVVYTYGWDAICTLKDKKVYDCMSMMAERYKGMFCKEFEAKGGD